MACKLATIQRPGVDASVTPVQTTRRQTGTTPTTHEDALVLADEMADPRIAHYAIVAAGSWWREGATSSLTPSTAMAGSIWPHHSSARGLPGR